MFAVGTGSIYTAAAGGGQNASGRTLLACVCGGVDHIFDMDDGCHCMGNGGDVVLGNIVRDRASGRTEEGSPWFPCGQKCLCSCAVFVKAVTWLRSKKKKGGT